MGLPAAKATLPQLASKAQMLRQVVYGIGVAAMLRSAVAAVLVLVQSSYIGLLFKEGYL